MGLTALATASRAGEPARQMVPAVWAAGEVGRGPREPVELGDAVNSVGLSVERPVRRRVAC